MTMPSLTHYVSAKTRWANNHETMPNVECISCFFQMLREGCNRHPSIDKYPYFSKIYLHLEYLCRDHYWYVVLTDINLLEDKFNRFYIDNEIKSLTKVDNAMLILLKLTVLS